jgi:hypothetical protein
MYIHIEKRKLGKRASISKDMKNIEIWKSISISPLNLVLKILLISLVIKFEWKVSWYSVIIFPMIRNLLKVIRVWKAIEYSLSNFFI